MFRRDGILDWQHLLARLRGCARWLGVDPKYRRRTGWGWRSHPLLRHPSLFRPADFVPESGCVRVHFFLPGFGPDDVHVRVEDELLKVSAEKAGGRQAVARGAALEQPWECVAHAVPVPPHADPSRFATCFVGEVLIVAFAGRGGREHCGPAAGQAARPPRRQLRSPLWRRFI